MKKSKVTISVPTDSLSCYREIAKLAGVDVETVISVVLAIGVLMACGAIKEAIAKKAEQRG